MTTRAICTSALFAGISFLAACSAATGESEVGESTSNLDDAVTLGSTDYALAMESRITSRNRNTGAISTTTIKLLGRIAVTAQTPAAAKQAAKNGEGEGEDGDVVDGEPVAPPAPGTAVEFSLHTCRLILPTISDYQPKIDDSFLQSLPAIAYSGTLDAEGKLAAGPQAVLLGVRLANPLTDALPTSASDSRIYDQDRDNKPGVSIKVDTGILGTKKVYAAGRLIADVAGSVADGGAGNLTGSSNIDFSYKVIGDDIPFIDVASMAASAEAESEIIKKDTRFLAIPRASGLTCAQVISANPSVPFN